MVLAKAPVPGNVKTRLSPPWSLAQAADLAEAALADTLAVVGGAACRDRVVVLDGPAGSWVPAGFRVVPQCPGDMSARLAGAFSGCRLPALLIGMDTPQVTTAVLDEALERLAEPGFDAVLGPALDGGYWAIGLSRRAPTLFDGVPMSTAVTCRAQRQRMAKLGLRTRVLRPLRDVDRHADALIVARDAPTSRFGTAVHQLTEAGQA
jgi:rSAM/selenodomain-associated transferase 1